MLWPAKKNEEIPSKKSMKKAGQWLCTFSARGQNTIPQKRFASLGIPSEETLQLSWQAARTITHILRRASSQVCCVWNLLQAEKIDFFFCGQNMFFVFLGAAANGDNKLVMVGGAVQSPVTRITRCLICYLWWLVSFHRIHPDDARQIWQYCQSHLCWASEQFEPVLVVAERDVLSRNESAESDISAETNTTISNEFCTPGLLSWKVLLFFFSQTVQKFASWSLQEGPGICTIWKDVDSSEAECRCS